MRNNRTGGGASRSSPMKKTTATETTGAVSEMDQVELLLQAAHDDVLLKLSLNSHLARPSTTTTTISNSTIDASAASPSLPFFDSDLSRRFQALKSRPSPPNPSPPPPPPPPQVDDDLKGVLGDDLSARFDALRYSVNPPPSSLPSAASSHLRLSAPSTARDLPDRARISSNLDDEEDEVEMIIQWAKDAARLDPSPPSDEETGGDDEEEDDDTDSHNSSEDDRRDVDAKTALNRRPRPRKKP